MRDAFLHARGSRSTGPARRPSAGTTERVSDWLAKVALQALEERQGEEVAALDVELEAAGYPSRAGSGGRRRLSHGAPATRESSVEPRT